MSELFDKVKNWFPAEEIKFIMNIYLTNKINNKDSKGKRQTC